eukprot:CAMPEP_0170241582 /NCGR_PEP_ID=MMETSP0116_2-20130129/20560_1 /TAXON_ID=400756 /ORGANISM="Durinskia baltica, Strain CSIRO CS-38" /LENGTH=274 /DNA_ID=CAMNT_0010492423 /DNA_START=302 /DNA_END=1126 /DNA_ORIENTATION=+
MAPLAPEDPGMSVAEGTVASPCQATSLPRYREECTEWACKAPGPWPAYTSRKVGSFACKVLHDGNSHLNLQFGLGQMSGSQSQAHSGSAACTSTNTTLSTIEPAAWLAANGLALWTLVGLGAFIGGAHNGALWIFADVLALSQQRLLASSHALRRLANGFAPRAAFRLVATPHALRAARPNAIAGTAKCTATGHVLCIVMEEDRRARTASRSTGAAGPPCLQQGALSTHAVRNDKGERINASDDRGGHADDVEGPAAAPATPTVASAAINPIQP